MCGDRIRLLFLLQGREPGDQPGWVDASHTLLKEGVIESCRIVPYYGFAEEHGWPAFYQHVIESAAGMDANVVLFQHFHGVPADPTIAMQRLRAGKQKPYLVATSGDLYSRFFISKARSLLAAARNADLTFSSAMGGFAGRLRRAGARRIVWMPHGICQARFSKGLAPARYAPEYDVVFVGLLLATRNPFTGHAWGARHRWRMVQRLTKRYGRRFAVFGSGWDGCPSWQGIAPFAQQQDFYRRARVVLGGYPHGWERYYLSDRPFIAMGTGVPYCDFDVPGVESLFVPGEHWHLYRSDQELMSVVDRLLALSDSERLAHAAKVADYVWERHQQYHRLRSMLEIAMQCRDAERRGERYRIRSLPFALPGVRDNVESALPGAVIE